MKYRKKPVVVEATQWLEKMGDTLEGVFRQECLTGEVLYYVLTVHDEMALLDDGDWVIKEPRGEGHYPCKPDIFEVTYEPALTIKGFFSHTSPHTPSVRLPNTVQGLILELL